VALERRVHSVSANVDGQHMKWQQSLERSLRVLELTTQVDDDPMDKIRANDWACNNSYVNGDPKGAEKYLAETYAPAESLRNVFPIEVALSKRRILAYLSGNWEAVHALDDRSANEMSNSVLAMAHYQTGDFDKGKAYMNAMTAAGDRIDLAGSLWSLVAACFCYISGETDLLTEVEAIARDAIADAELSPLFSWQAQAALAQVDVLRHEASTAAEQYAALKPYPNAVTLTGAICADRLLGLLANTMGNLEDAVAHFEDALAFCRKAGYSPDLAWTCFDYANCLMERDASGAQERAKLLLDEALAISTDLGMRPLMNKVTALSEKSKYRPTTKPRYPVGLTRREVEVLCLVASGKSNAQIASELVLSIRTVERHISNIYIKTNSRARADATAFAFAHELILPG